MSYIAEVSEIRGCIKMENIWLRRCDISNGILSKAAVRADSIFL